MPKNIEHLVEFFRPSEYKIDLDIDVDNMKFKGNCEIRGYKNNLQTPIKLHAKDLKIIKVTYLDKKADYKLDGDTLEINPAKNMNQSDVIVKIAYEGKITKAMHGIYPSTTKNGSKIISTQFESHHAREAFPCVDEPEAKASFELSIKTSGEYKVLSNMPVVSTARSESFVKTKFAVTPPMSSYLLAFTIGELHSIKAKTKSGVEIGVWSSTDHDKQSLTFALDVAVRSIEFLEDYFNVPYPLPKLDNVAIPDFSSAAMENWGLVIYREIALLTHPDKVSTSSREMIALVIAHELSHQWFGNLVTMQWWDDLWLNESFATLMEYVIVDNLFPEWNIMLTFAAHEALSAFRRDILPGVQPVATGVNHPDEISTLFDPSIVYAKGARLLWMAYNLVGEEAFRNGLHNYFNKYQYSSARGNDLWESLSQSSGLDIGSIMDKWLTLPGLPYLEIEPTDDGLSVRQYKLTSEGPANHIVWPIPLWTDKLIDREMLEDKKALIKTSNPNVRFNIVGGHYVCDYKSHQTRKLIRQQITDNLISPEARLFIINDAMLLSRCTIAPIHQMLDTISSYRAEDQEAIWGVISLALSDVKMLIEDDKTASKKLKEFVYNLISAKFNDLDFNGNNSENTNDKKLRSLLSSLAIYSEDQEYINEALKIYKDHNLDELDPDIRSAVLTAAVKHGETSAFRALLEQYPKEIVADVKSDIAAALCTTKQKSNINLLINKLKNDSFVKLQDLDRFIIYLLRNIDSRNDIWNWLVKNWGWIEENFASDKSYDNYPRYAAITFSTEQWLERYKKHFLPLKKEPALKRNIEIGIKEIENKINWRNKELNDLKAWLKSQ